jgi:hypothetical protein
MTDKSKDTPNGVADSKRRAIGDEIDLFVRQIDSLANTLPIAMHVVRAAHQSSRQEYERFLEQECKITRDDGHTKTFTVEGSKYFQFRRLEGRFQKANLAFDLVPRTFLVSLVSQFDAFLGRLIRQLFIIKPEALDSTASTLTFAQLTTLSSVEDAREYIIDKEVESVLRKSHPEQFDWLENKFGLRLRVDLKVWPVFVEVTERRNLFVHANGIVSNQYLDICKRHGSTVDPGLVAGKILSVSPDYFDTAHECLFEIGVKLAQVFWRKLEPDDLELADGNLLSVGYELLEEGRYRLARCLLDFSTETLKKHGKEEQRLSMVINRAQAYKWSGDNAMAQKIIGDVDWSAMGLKFQMAQAVLLDDFNRALEIMVKIGTNGDISKMGYREWPLFKEIRKVKDFARTFEDIFGEPLSRISLDRKSHGSTDSRTIQ